MGSKYTAGGDGVYIDFDPTYEFIQKEKEDIFVVHLTGFEMEQFTVQVKRDRKVAISGERPLSDDRWSRFRKEFPVPADCNTQKITAKFDAGLLYLFLPKSPPMPPQIPNRKQQRPPPQIPNPNQHHPSPTQPQTTPSSARGSKIEQPSKQSVEEKKTTEDSSSIKKDYYYDEPLKQRTDEEEEKTIEESSIKKDYSYDRLKRDPKDRGDITGDVQRRKREEYQGLGSRVELGNLKLKMGSLELELHRTKQLVKGLLAVIAVFMAIGFYLQSKFISSSTRRERQP